MVTGEDNKVVNNVFNQNVGDAIRMYMCVKPVMMVMESLEVYATLVSLIVFFVIVIITSVHSVLKVMDLYTSRTITM